MALDGKIDFIRKTNPWGSGDDAEPKPGDPPLTEDGELDRAVVMKRLEKAFDLFS